MNRATLLIIDGNAIVHRAYHAYPPLTKNDMPVGAVYGFFSMFFKVLDQLRPQFVAMCFDRPAPTFRQTLFAGYQQHRPKMADDLSIQIDTIHSILKEGNIQVFEVDGYEADDMIGTLATQATKDNQDVVILSGDRDMLQLVNLHIHVLMPLVGITKTVLFTEGKVIEKYGINPSQFVDYKALIGDASDGYPGVNGIGPKTAAKLLQKHGSFEQLYSSLSSLPAAIAEKLALYAEQASLAKKLATIVTDAPITLKLQACHTSEFNVRGIADVFKKLEFKSLQQRFPKYLTGSSEIKKTKHSVPKDAQLGLL